MRPSPVVDDEPEFAVRTGDVCLTEEETEKVRRACRAHGVTVTHFFTALVVLAEVEWVLTVAQDAGEEYIKEAIEAYEKATHILSAWSIVDQVCMPSNIRTTRTPNISNANSASA